MNSPDLVERVVEHGSEISRRIFLRHHGREIRETFATHGRIFRVRELFRERKEAAMKECFGTIYPDLTQIQFGKVIAGKVFRLRIDTIGAYYRERNLESNVREWQECQACEDFRNCYDFSTAKFLMQQFMMQV